MASPHSPQTSSSIHVSREPAPRTLQLAAAMFVLYGVAIVLNATIFAAVAGSRNVGDVLRILLHLLGAGLVARGLLHRARWAWWAGLGLALSVLATGILTISVIEHGDIYWLPPSHYQLFFVGGLLSIGAAVALLLASSAWAGVHSSRAYWRAGLPRRDGHGRALARAGTVQSLMKTHW